MLVALDEFLANIAAKSAAPALDLVTPITLDVRLFALWAVANFGIADSFFDCETTFGLFLLFHFVAAEWNMRGFSTFDARERNRFAQSMSNVLHNQ